MELKASGKREDLLAIGSIIVSIIIAVGIITDQIPMSEGALLITSLLVSNTIIRERTRMHARKSGGNP